MNLLPLYKKVFIPLLIILMSVSSALFPLGALAQQQQQSGVGQGVGVAAASLAQCLSGGVATATGGALITFALTVPVSDVASQIFEASGLTRECLLDAIAVLLRETLIRKITTSIVNWINTGFEGSPSFVTNIDQFLVDTADEVFGAYIYNNSNFAHLCSPFQYDIRFALAFQYSTNQYRPQCTLSQVTDNIENAIDNLSVEWDWDVYETITTDPSGNIFTAFIQEQSNVSASINNELQKKQDDIERGNGFLSFEECVDADNNNSYVVSALPSSDFTSTNKEQECSIVTPGSVIGGTLTKQIGLDTDRLALADEINEIIGALIGQLAQQAFGGGGSGGIKGLSERQGSSQSFLAQYNQDAGNATQEFATDVSRSIEQTSGAQADQYIAVQEENLKTLLSASRLIEAAQTCFDTKYNTWLDEDGDIIPTSQVSSTSQDSRERAAFLAVSSEATPYNRGRLYFDVLTPAQSRVKLDEYDALLTRIDTDIASSERAITDAGLAVEQSAAIRSRLDTTTDPNEIQELYGNYSSLSGTSGIDLNMATASQQNINSYTDIGLNGQISFNTSGQVRTGGAIEDLANCQRFTEVVRSSEVPGGTEI
jgi:hypothetical protein